MCAKTRPDLRINDPYKGPSGVAGTPDSPTKPSPPPWHPVLLLALRQTNGTVNVYRTECDEIPHHPHGAATTTTTTTGFGGYLGGSGPETGVGAGADAANDTRKSDRVLEALNGVIEM